MNVRWTKPIEVMKECMQICGKRQIPLAELWPRACGAKDRILCAPKLRNANPHQPRQCFHKISQVYDGKFF